ncbi:hypothetical protein WDU94_010988 [Cyamophila willieti]
MDSKEILQLLEQSFIDSELDEDDENGDEDVDEVSCHLRNREAILLEQEKEENDFFDHMEFFVPSRSNSRNDTILSPVIEEHPGEDTFSPPVASTPQKPRKPAKRAKPASKGQSKTKSKKHDEIMSPVEYFQKFIDDDLIQILTDSSNKYVLEEKEVDLNLTFEGTKVYIGILILMALVPMRQLPMYWQKETRFSPIADAMSRNRFCLIKQHFHVADNSAFDVSNPDKLFKAVVISNNIYVKNKPHKWGYKLFSRARSSGFLYDFVIYTGQNTAHDHELGISGNIVLDLVSTLPQGKTYEIYFDSWFSSLKLSAKLSDMNIKYVATIRESRNQNCPLKSEKELRKEGRGSFDWKVDANSGAVLVRWLVRKSVQCISNYVGVHPVGSCKRWSEKERKKIDIPRPAIIGEYDQFMGEVDLFDMLIEMIP